METLVPIHNKNYTLGENKLEKPSIDG
jgi:hypothetical protein